MYIDREFINLINFRKIRAFGKSTGMAALPVTLASAAGWPKVWGPQYERCPISINDIFDMHNTAVLYRDSGTALPKGGFFKGDMRDSEAH